MKTIVHVVEAWQGGIATYLEALATAQSDEGHSVYILADEELFNNDPRELPNITFLWYKSSRNPLGVYKAMKSILCTLNHLKPDIVHSHSSFPGVYVRGLKNNHCIVHTPHSWGFSQTGTGKIKQILFGLIEKHLSTRCKYIICISQDEINSAKSININSNKLKLVHTGIKDLPPANTPINTKKIRVGYFGRFDYQKGFDILQSSIGILNENIELHFYGGLVRSNIQLIDSPKCHYHGWIKSNEIHNRMHEVDIIIVPSRWEGFALVPIEAMRAGKGVIISSNSSLPEAVITDYNGLILKDSSATTIAETLNKLTNESIQVLGENARQVYERCFEFDIFYRKVSEIYND